MQYLLAQLFETWQGFPSRLPPAALELANATTATSIMRTERDFFMTLLLLDRNHPVS